MGIEQIRKTLTAQGHGIKFQQADRPKGGKMKKTDEVKERDGKNVWQRPTLRHLQLKNTNGKFPTVGEGASAGGAS